MVYLVVWVINSEVSHTDDDFVKQLFRGMLGTVPEQRADDVSERQREALSSKNRLAEQRIKHISERSL